MLIEVKDGIIINTNFLTQIYKKNNREIVIEWVAKYKNEEQSSTFYYHNIDERNRWYIYILDKINNNTA